jgi:hypothetical protein
LGNTENTTDDKPETKEEVVKPEKVINYGEVYKSQKYFTNLKVNLFNPLEST